MRRSHCCRHGKLGQICRRRAAASGECGCATAQGVARLCYCPTCFGPLFYGFVKSMSIFNGDAILIGCIVWDAGLRHAVLSLPASGTNYYPESKGTGDNPLASAHSPGAARGGTCHQRCGVWCAEEPRGSPPACCSFSLLLRWRLQLAPAPHSTGLRGSANGKNVLSNWPELAKREIMATSNGWSEIGCGGFRIFKPKPALTIGINKYRVWL